MNATPERVDSSSLLSPGAWEIVPNTKAVMQLLNTLADNISQLILETTGNEMRLGVQRGRTESSVGKLWCECSLLSDTLFVGLSAEVFFRNALPCEEFAKEKEVETVILQLEKVVRRLDPMNRFNCRLVNYGWQSPRSEDADGHIELHSVGDLEQCAAQLVVAPRLVSRLVEYARLANSGAETKRMARMMVGIELRVTMHGISRSDIAPGVQFRCATRLIDEREGWRIEAELITKQRGGLVMKIGNRRSLNEEKLEFNIIMGQVFMSYAEFLNLEEGALVDFGLSPEDPLFLALGDEIIASAHAVRREDGLAIEIDEILSELPREKQLDFCANLERMATKPLPTAA